jgi:hypothetical protein
MDTLVLIGIVLLLTVAMIDCFVRLVILWNMRKRKRAVKPIGMVVEIDAPPIEIVETNGQQAMVNEHDDPHPPIELANPIGRDDLENA